MPVAPPQQQSSGLLIHTTSSSEAQTTEADFETISSSDCSCKYSCNCKFDSTRQQRILTEVPLHKLSSIPSPSSMARGFSESCLTQATEEVSHSSHEDEEEEESDDNEETSTFKYVCGEEEEGSWKRIDETNECPELSNEETSSESPCEENPMLPCPLQDAPEPLSCTRPPIPPPRVYQGSILKRCISDTIPIVERRSSWKCLPKLDLELIRTRSECVVQSKPCRERQRRSNIIFTDVHIRSFDQTIGDNPSVSYGPPISLDWSFEDMDPLTLDDYEANRGKRRTPRQMMLNYYNRINLLTYRFGVSEKEIKKVDKEMNKIKRSRALTKALLPACVLEDFVQSAARKTKRLTQKSSKSKE